MDFFAIAAPALAEAFALILSPAALGYLAGGVLLGLCVGVFPGLGGIAGLSLVLPFVYGMDTVSGLSLMVGLIAVIPTSDTFASVLLGIPGSSASQATVLDGFPLSRRGEAARALSAAFASSLFGGLFGAVLLTFFILIARPLVLAFRLPELMLLTLLGFSMVGVLAGNHLLKGLISVGLGAMVGAVGEAPAQGSSRMDFGAWYLQDGLQLIVIGLGIFAIPEILALLRQGSAISRNATLGAGWWNGLTDWWRNRWLSLRCATIGVLVGVIPGLGGSVVDWIAYGHTVQTSRDKGTFGHGDIRGVIGPESSNNAKEGGGLVPTLLFGVPGSGAMAVFIGGLILLGYEAGPQMIRNDLPLTYTIVWSLALANLFGAGLCIFLSGAIARLTTVRFPLLVPFLFMLIAFAVFQSKQTLWDIAALVGIGVLGLFMKRFDWSRPAFLIGFVLADQTEVYTYQVTQLAMFRHKIGGADAVLDYLFTPLSLSLMAVIIISIWLGVKHMRHRHQDADTTLGGARIAPMVFTAAIALFLAVSLVDALRIGVLIDKVFPAAVAAFALGGCLLLLVQMVRTHGAHVMFYDAEYHGREHSTAGSAGAALGWFVSLLALTALFGFVIAIALFFVAFLRYRERLSWLRVSLMLGAALGFLIPLAALLRRDFPPGLLQHLMTLPWPLSGR